MATRYYLINTMRSVEARHIGVVISTHRTEAAAERANAKLKRRVSRNEGPTHYIPAVIKDSSEVTIDHSDAWRR